MSITTQLNSSLLEWINVAPRVKFCMSQSSTFGENYSAPCSAVSVIAQHLVF